MLWQAYYLIEPWGDEVRYLAMLLSAVCKSGNWERFMPDRFQTMNSRFTFMTAEESVKNDRAIAKAMAEFANRVQSGNFEEP